MKTLSMLLRRANRVLQNEGLISLLRQAFAIVVGWFFKYRTYYLYEQVLGDIRKLNEANYIPKIDNYTFKVISTNQEADDLEAVGLEFRSHVPNARKRLDKGAIAFCIFVGQELAHIGWVALTQQAKDTLPEPPYKLDFLSKEACGSDTWTNRKYRRRGLRLCSVFKRYEFMLNNGIMISRSAIAKKNIASQKGREKFSPRIYAEGRYLKILWWKSWRERPLPPS